MRNVTPTNDASDNAASAPLTVDSVAAAIVANIAPVTASARPAAVAAVNKATGKSAGQGFGAGSKRPRLAAIEAAHAAGFRYNRAALPRIVNPSWKAGDTRGKGHEPFLRQIDDAGHSGWDVFELACLCPSHAANPHKLYLTRDAANDWFKARIPNSDIGSVA